MLTAYIPIPHGRNSQGRPITRIVYHALGEFIRDHDGQVYYCVDWLKKKGLSAHAFATPSGVIIRGRHDNQVAWHARGFNFGSLGIEFLVPGIHNYGTFLERIKKTYLTNVQLRAGIDQTLEWLGKYPIENVDAHSDIDPDRKYDPGDGLDKQGYLEGIGWA